MLKPMFTATLFIIGIFIYSDAFAEDMRTEYKESHEQKQLLINKAKKEADLAKKDAEKIQQHILSDRAALLKAVSDLEIKNAQLEKDSTVLEKNILELKKEEQVLRIKLSETEGVNKELSGFIRGNAKDLKTLLTQSLQSAIKRDREKFLQPMISQTRFPSMDDIHTMTNVLFDEIKSSGEVRLEKGIIVDRNGRENMADILILGNFSAAYILEKETGFLLFSDQSQRLFALSKLPERRIAKKIKNYMQGKSDGVYLDISKGGALRQLTHKLSLMAQIPKGGPIVWPILAILGFAVLIVIERIIFLFRKKIDVDAFTKTISSYLSKGDWDQCNQLCDANLNKSIPRILKAGIECRNMDRIDIENALQESILHEIPSLERFMSTLGMLAAIAPLLGLLGTVTGMINTFHVITYYGTGDPRMMSGGISEALVTTMLGLTVAIPIMLAHTLLSRKIETEIGLMEEKAVSFVNTMETVKG